VLVGINESGKSNILRALSLLDPDVEVEPDDLREIRPREKPFTKAYVRFVFRVEPSDQESVVKVIRSKIGGKFDEPIIKIGRDRLSVLGFVKSRAEALYTVDLLKNERRHSYYALPDDAKIVGPWRWVPSKPAGAAASPKATDFIIVDPRMREFAGMELQDFEPEDLNHLVCTEFNKVLAEQLPTVLFWEYDEDQLLPGEIRISDFSADPETCIPLMHMFQLAGYSDIPAELERAGERPNGMRNLLKRVSAISTQHLHRVWKEYQHVDFELVQNGDRINAHILDQYNTYDLSRRSDGFKRFVSFLLHISVKARADELTNTLYLDDEPDVGLHPSGARYLRDELVKVSKENYVVYATHSIFMIDGDHLNRHAIVSKKNEVTTVEEANESNFATEEVLFNALGYSLFEHLRAVNIVFEGWRDKRLFETALSDHRTKSNAVRALFSTIGRCFARGAKDVGRITAMLELARRACVVLSDSDQPAREHQRGYKGYGTWFRYDEVFPAFPALTGEDFVTDDTFLLVLKRIQSQDARLVRLPPIIFEKRHGKLKTIAAWFSRGGIAGDELKSVLEQVKQAVFDNLRAEQIEWSYYEMLNRFHRLLPKSKK
jgi:hypothetical protein